MREEMNYTMDELLEKLREVVPSDGVELFLMNAPVEDHNGHVATALSRQLNVQYKKEVINDVLHVHNLDVLQMTRGKVLDDIVLEIANWIKEYENPVSIGLYKLIEEGVFGQSVGFILRYSVHHPDSKEN